jgi:predicted nucleotidyltransferase
MNKYNINQTTLKIIGLYRNDYSVSLHVRSVARKTNVDVKAIQLQLRTLEKTNILSSQTNGKNKEYRLNLNNYLTKYYMVLSETYATITYLTENFEIKKLNTEIQNNIDGSILLFGSFANNEMTKESDIDLLIISNKKTNEEPIKEAGRIIDREINIKFATEKMFLEGLASKDPLINEVVANHIILKGIDPICNILWRYYERR